MPLEEIRLNSIGRNGWPSDRVGRESRDGRDGRSLRSPSLQQENLRLRPDAVQSMLRNTTENADPALFSIKPTRIPHPISRGPPQPSYHSFLGPDRPLHRHGSGFYGIRPGHGNGLQLPPRATISDSGYRHHSSRSPSLRSLGPESYQYAESDYYPQHDSQREQYVTSYHSAYGAPGDLRDRRGPRRTDVNYIYPSHPQNGGYRPLPPHMPEPANVALRDRTFARRGRALYTPSLVSLRSQAQGSDHGQRASPRSFDSTPTAAEASDDLRRPIRYGNLRPPSRSDQYQRGRPSLTPKSSYSKLKPASERASSPLFYDYSEGFDEEVYYSANGSATSLPQSSDGLPHNNHKSSITLGRTGGSENPRLNEIRAAATTKGDNSFAGRHQNLNGGRSRMRGASVSPTTSDESASPKATGNNDARGNGLPRDTNHGPFKGESARHLKRHEDGERITNHADGHAELQTSSSDDMDHEAPTLDPSHIPSDSPRSFIIPRVRRAASIKSGEPGAKSSKWTIPSLGLEPGRNSGTFGPSAVLVARDQQLSLHSPMPHRPISSHTYVNRFSSAALAEQGLADTTHEQRNGSMEEHVGSKDEPAFHDIDIGCSAGKERPSASSRLHDAHLTTLKELEQQSTDIRHVLVKGDSSFPPESEHRTEPARLECSPLPAKNDGHEDFAGSAQARSVEYSSGTRPRTTSTTDTDYIRASNLRDSFPWLTGDVPALPSMPSQASFGRDVGSRPISAFVNSEITPSKRAQDPSRDQESRMFERKQHEQKEAAVEEVTSSKFKIKLRQHAASLTGLRVWSNSSPHTRHAERVIQGADDGSTSTRLKPLPPKPPKFKLRVTRASNSIGRGTRVDASTIEPSSDDDAFISGTIADKALGIRSSIGSFGRMLGFRTSSTRSEKTLSVTTSPASDVGSDPRISLPVIQTVLPSETRSFFSDDSSHSRTGSRGTVRKRLSDLKAKLDASKAASVQGAKPSDVDRAPLVPEVARPKKHGTELHAPPTRNVKPTSLLDKLREWILRAKNKAIDLGRRVNGSQTRPLTPSARRSGNATDHYISQY